MSSTEDNIARMSKGLSQECQDDSKKFAELSVKANPKLARDYIMGKSALVALVAWATQESKGTIHPSLTGEWCVIFLEEKRVAERDHQRDLRRKGLI